jgi:TonB-dependent starch-binding outer membrane protein SusC
MEMRIVELLKKVMSPVMLVVLFGSSSDALLAFQNESGITSEQVHKLTISELQNMPDKAEINKEIRVDFESTPLEEFIGDDSYQETVSGTIIDGRTGEPLPGVNILIEGTGTGTTTDISGFYTLTALTSNETLIVSFIGYETQSIPIDGRSEINIEMQSLMYRGDELVVVGYGVQRRSDISGSVGIVSRADLEQPTFNTLQSLRGKVAGVNVFTNSGSPTGSNRVIIRGVGTINASPDPLYVVDGVVMENIEFMNPNDIESIEVLKDATATAIYGARGANGVILITTARGADQGILV